MPVGHLWAAGLGELLVGLWVTGRHQSCPGENPNPGGLQAKLLLLTEPPCSQREEMRHQDQGTDTSAPGTQLDLGLDQRRLQLNNSSMLVAGLSFHPIFPGKNCADVTKEQTAPLQLTKGR